MVVDGTALLHFASITEMDIMERAIALTKPVFRFTTRSDTNRAVQPQIAGGLKFQI